MNDELPTQADLKALVEDLRGEDSIAYIERALTALCARYEAYIAIHAPRQLSAGIPAVPNAIIAVDYTRVIVLVEKGEVRE